MRGIEPLQLKMSSGTCSAMAGGSGQLVLLLHGFPDTMHTFQGVLPALIKQGFRAVAVTLPGYEPGSQAICSAYKATELTDWVVDCIDALGAESAHLVGHDWGAAIGYQVGHKYPTRLKSLTALSVPHSGVFTRDAMFIAKQRKLSWYMFYFQLRGKAERRVRADNFALLDRLWRDWSPGWEPPNMLLDLVKMAFTQPRVVESALHYYRAAMAPTILLPWARRQLAFEVPVPTLAISGENDACIDTQVFEQLTQPEYFTKGVEFVRIPKAGHWPHLENPEICLQAIIPWLERVSS